MKSPARPANGEMRRRRDVLFHYNDTQTATRSSCRQRHRHEARISRYESDERRRRRPVPIVPSAKPKGAREALTGRASVGGGITDHCPSAAGFSPSYRPCRPILTSSRQAGSPCRRIMVSIERKYLAIEVAEKAGNAMAEAPPP